MHAPPLLFLRPKPSRQLVAVLGAIHGMAALALALTGGPPPWLLASGLVALAVSFMVLVRRHALQRAPGAILRLQSRADGVLEGLTVEGEWIRFHLLPETTLFPFLVVLCLREEGGGRRHLTLLPDALAPGDWRRLQVWLRWAASTEKPGTEPGL